MTVNEDFTILATSVLIISRCKVLPSMTITKSFSDNNKVTQHEEWLDTGFIAKIQHTTDEIKEV